MRRFNSLLLLTMLALPVGCRSHQRAATASPAPPATPSTVTHPPKADAPPPAPAWQTIGTSVRDRPLRATTIGRGPFRIYLIGGIHGNEPEGLAAAGRIAALAPSELQAVSIRILADANPDGTAAGTRGNARGRDLNRNWPASNFRGPRGVAPLSEPETQAVSRDLDRFSPHLMIVFHSIASGPFVNFDGPAEERAAAFAEAARVLDPRWKVVPQMGYRTPGSMGSRFGIDRGVPILTIEFDRGQDRESATAQALAGVRALVEQESRAARASVLQNQTRP